MSKCIDPASLVRIASQVCLRGVWCKSRPPSNHSRLGPVSVCPLLCKHPLPRHSRCLPTPPKGVTPLGMGQVPTRTGAFGAPYYLNARPLWSYHRAVHRVYHANVVTYDPITLCHHSDTRPHIISALGSYRANTLPLSYQRHALSYQRHAPIIPTPCPYHDSTVPLSYQYHAPIIPIPCPYHTNAMPLSCQHHAPIIPIPCPYHTNTMPLSY